MSVFTPQHCLTNLPALHHRRARSPYAKNRDQFTFSSSRTPAIIDTTRWLTEWLPCRLKNLALGPNRTIYSCAWICKCSMAWHCECTRNVCCLILSTSFGALLNGHARVDSLVNHLTRRALTSRDAYKDATRIRSCAVRWTC